MGRPASALDLPVRRGINATFTHVIAHITLSIAGVMTGLTVIFAGHSLLATTYAVRIIISRGVPPSALTAVGLYRDGLARHVKTGFLLSGIVVAFGLLVSYDVGVVLGVIRSVPVAIAVASLAVLCMFGCLFPYFVVLFERTRSLTLSVREANVLFVSNLRFSLLFVVVVGSIVSVSTLSVVGIALIGYGVIATISVFSTDYLYEDMSGDRILD